MRINLNPVNYINSFKNSQINSANNIKHSLNISNSLIKPLESDVFTSTTKPVSFSSRLLELLPEVTQMGNTASARTKNGKIARRNIEEAYKFIDKNADRLPTIKDYQHLNKIFVKDLPQEVEAPIYLAGLIKGSPDLSLLGKDFLLNDKDMTPRIEKYFDWLHRHHGEQDISRVAGRTYRELISCCPFYDGNGRTSRAILDWILYHDGYIMEKHPIEMLNARKIGTQGITDLIEKNAKKIDGK